MAPRVDEYDKPALASATTIVGRQVLAKSRAMRYLPRMNSDSISRFQVPGVPSSLSRAIAGDLDETPIAQVSMSVFGEPDVVPLWFGESDVVTPDFVREAASKALAAGETFYTWQRGTPELRAALSTYTERLYGIKCPVDRISLTTGGMQAILLACQLLVDPGDNIVIISPIWPNITSATHLMRGETKYVALDRRPDGGWSLDLQKLFDAVDGRTRAIFVNSPNNPTGWTITSEEQAAILDFARKRGIWIMADEVYARLTYKPRARDGKLVAPSFLEQAGPNDPLLVLNSFSKPWAMTGWRLGWLTHPAALGDQFAKLVQINTSGVPAFLQRGAIAALEKGDGFVAEMVERCRAGREQVFQRLSALPRVTLSRPEAAFYAFFKVDGVTDTMSFCKKLAKEYKVGTAPGEAFAEGGQGNIRLCFASSAEQLSKGLDRIEAAIKAL
jgi:aspartate aminotransferase